MAKTISAFRINKGLIELDNDSDAFSVFKRKESFIPSFFLVSSGWKTELKHNNVVNVLAEFKFLEHGKPFVKIFDSSLSEEQVFKSALKVDVGNDGRGFGELSIAL